VEPLEGQALGPRFVPYWMPRSSFISLRKPRLRMDVPARRPRFVTESCQVPCCWNSGLPMPAMRFADGRSPAPPSTYALEPGPATDATAVPNVERALALNSDA